MSSDADVEPGPLEEPIRCLPFDSILHSYLHKVWEAEWKVIEWVDCL
jgi:hypothetical protein